MLVLLTCFDHVVLETLNINLSSPKPGHTTGGSGRGARRIGGVGLGRTGCQQNCLPKRLDSLVPSKASRTRGLNVFPEARISELLCKRNAGTKPAVDNRFICSLSAVYLRFTTWTRKALSSWLLTSVLSPLCPCKPFPCKACPGSKCNWPRCKFFAPKSQDCNYVLLFVLPSFCLLVAALVARRQGSAKTRSRGKVLLSPRTAKEFSY